MSWEGQVLVNWVLAVKIPESGRYSLPLCPRLSQLAPEGPDIWGSETGSIGGTVVRHGLGFALGFDPLFVVLEFPCDCCFVPTEKGRHD